MASSAEPLQSSTETLLGLVEGTVGLDVFPEEPPDVSHRIFKDPRCLCAPHLVGGSRLAMERISRSMATDMVSVVEGRRPQFCVNPDVFG